MTTTAFRRISCSVLALASATTPGYASFHFMQIEQIIAGVNGDITAQAIQLRMRASGQNFIAPSRLVVRDVAGMNPIVVINFTTSVPSGSFGSRILIASPSFMNVTDPPAGADFDMTSLIPPSYFAAGSVTFETDGGSTIYWRLSWGGAAYTGSNSGSFTNDGDGNFGPPWPGPLPTDGTQALVFQGSASAPSTANADDYALTDGAAVFTNNAGTSFVTGGPEPRGACCDALAGACMEDVPQDECIADGRRFGGADSTCAGLDPPCTPSGACCDPSNGVCKDDGVSRAECELADLNYGGDGSTCDTIDPLCAADRITIDLEEVASGLTSPVHLTHAGDGSGRLFVVDQAGFIRVIDAAGNLLTEPFLDLTDRIPDLGTIFDERGVLGLAFHPDYANNGRFFVRYSAPRAGDPAEPCNDPEGFVVGCHEERLAEFSVLGDPATSDVADPNSETILFRIDEPEFNHDAGGVAFGPDGFLYFSLGDGGGGNDGLQLNGLCDAGTCEGDKSVCSVSTQDCTDTTTCVSGEGVCTACPDDPSPICDDDSACLLSGTRPHGLIGNAQNIDTALGSLLRIDVDSAPDAGLAYAIPPDNPFVGTAGLDEIYAYGLRNPFGFSFDDGPGGSGMLYLADVGQHLFEEVNIIVKGGNYGWVIKEGFHCFDPFLRSCTDPSELPLPPVQCADVGTVLGDPLIDPIMEYGHPTSNLPGAGGLAALGGFVYRGSLNPSLAGHYVFGDFSFGRLLYFDTVGAAANELREFVLADGQPFDQFVKGMGEDEDGELYFLATDALAPFGATGVVYRIAPPPPPSTTPTVVGVSPRYLEITPPNLTTPFGLFVTPACGGAIGRYVGTPFGDNNIALTVGVSTSAAFLTSDAWGTVRITGEDIVPGTSYGVRVNTGTPSEPVFSEAAFATTARWGDVAGPFDVKTGTFGPPDGTIDIPTDIVALIEGFASRPAAPPIFQSDLVGLANRCVPDQQIDFTADVLFAICAFQGRTYTDCTDCPEPCP